MRQGKAVITVSTAQSPTHAFQKIVDHHILSAPVWDAQANKFIGFLDTRDLTQFVVFQADELNEKKKHLKESSSKTNLLEPPPSDLKFIFESAARMYQQPLENVTVSYLARTNKWTAVHDDDTLLRVVELLSTGNHRLPVVPRDNPNTILDIISQSSIVQFIQQHHLELTKALSVRIADIKLGSRPVIPVNEHTAALDCFKTMSKLNRSGIAIVDDKGTLIGNTSGSDLRLFISNPDKHVRLLNQPVTDFLSTIRRAEVVENPNTRSPVIAVHPDADLAKVIGKLSATRVHRLFVADDKTGFKPEAVISITDILRYIVAESTPKSAVKISVDSV